MVKEFEFVVEGCAVKMVYERGGPPEDPNYLLKAQADDHPNKLVGIWWQDHLGDLVIIAEMEDLTHRVSFDEGQTWQVNVPPEPTFEVL